MSSVAAGVALAALASVLFNAAIVIQTREAREVPQDREHGLQLSLMIRLLRRPRWLLGTALGLIAFPLQTIALLWAPLTAVQPADATGLLVLLFLGTRMLHEHVGRRELIAVVSIVAGIVILTIAAPKREVTQVDGAAVILPMLAVAVVALAPLVLRRWVGATSLAAMRQAFAGGRDLSVPDNVLIAAAACELHPRALLKGVETASVRNALDEATAAAAERGVDELPAIVVEGRVFSGPRSPEHAAAA